MNISTKTRVLNNIRKVFTIPLLEKILLLFTVDKRADSFFSKLIPNNYQYAPNTYRIFKRDDIVYKVDLYDYMGWYLYFGLVDDTRSALYALSNKNATIIDVGANIGETLLNFAKRTLPNGEVHGFEPDSLNYQHCSENLGLNNFKNIFLNNVGLGSETGQTFIRIDTPSNRGGNKISAEYIEDATNVIKIITLDQYVTAKQIQKIDLIKIDVEGYELNVLKGAAEVIRKFRPVLFIELDDNNLREQGHSAKSLIHFLSQFNYTIKNSETEEIITEFADFSNCHYDIICNAC